MLKRGQSAAFMPASYVFPGGVVELNDDGRFPEARTNWNYVNANPIKMEEHKNDYVYRIAALRELFEEAGILLTYNTNNRVSQLASSADDASLAEWRKKVRVYLQIIFISRNNPRFMLSRQDSASFSRLRCKPTSTRSFHFLIGSVRFQPCFNAFC